MGVEQDVMQNQAEQEQPASNDAPKRVSRRNVLATGLTGGGLLALGVSGFALWKYEQRALRVIDHLSPGITTLTWSPDGRSFAAGDSVGDMAVWKFNGPQVYSRQLLDDYYISSIDWSPNGKYLAVGGDGRSHIWLAQNGNEIAVYDYSERSLAWSPNGKMIASGGKYGLIQIWEPANGQSVNSFQAYTNVDDTFLTINSIAWSPDGTQVATVGPDPHKLLALWNVTTGQTVILPLDIQVKNTITSRMNAIGWSPDGMHIAAGYADGRKVGRVVLWSWQAQTKTWQYTSSAPAHFQTVHKIAWSPDSMRFASIGLDTKVQLWNLSSYGLQMDISASAKGLAGSSSLQALSWSPNGKYVLVGDDIGQILLWDVE